MQVHDQVNEPVVVHGQEVLKVIDAPAPAVLQVARLQPADTDAHVDGRDKFLPGQRRRSGHLHPCPEIRLAHGTEPNAGNGHAVAINGSWL